MYSFEVSNKAVYTKTTKMNEQERHRIANILVKDSFVIQKWQHLWDELGLGRGGTHFTTWSTAMKNGTGVYDELFKAMLALWVQTVNPNADVEALCEKLKSIKCLYTAQCIQKTDVTNTHKPGPRWHLPFSVGKVVNNFVGRRTELRRLHKVYEENLSNIIVICGLGGIGKTELVKKFAQEMYNKGGVCSSWFNAENEKALKQSLVTFLQNNGMQTLTGNDHKTDNLLMELLHLMNTIEGSTLWLVIFDNVNDLNADLVHCLQFLNNSKKVLTVLTSRRRNLRIFEARFIALEEWNISDAMKFVKASITDDEDVSIFALCKKLGNHALAMQQAVDYITQQQRDSTRGFMYSIREYLTEFQSTDTTKRLHLLGYKLCQISHSSETPTFVRWNNSIAEILKTEDIGQLSLKILKVLSYFNPNSINLKFLGKTLNLLKIFSADLKTPYCDQGDSIDEIISKAASLLKSFSFINIENFVITINRLVQEVFRLKVNLSKEELPLLTTLLTEVPNWTFHCSQDVTQLLSLWKHALNYEELILQFANVPCCISDLLVDFGLYSELQKFTERNQLRLTLVLGPKHRSTLEMEDNVARVLEAKGKFQDSLKVFQVLLKKKQNFLGEKDERTLLTAQSLAFNLYYLQQIEQSKIIWEELLKFRTEILGEDHMDTMRVRHNLALILSSEGKLDAAREMNNNVLQWRITNFGKKHPHTLTSKHNIGVILYKQEKCNEAKKVLEDVLTLMIEVLCDKHPHTLTSKHNIGVILYKQEKYDEAKEVLENVLTLMIEVLCDKHPHTLSTKYLIALSYFQLGNEEKCLEILTEVLTLREMVLSENHLDTVATKSCFAFMLKKRGETDLALKMFNQVLEWQQKELGQHDPNMLTTKHNIGKCLYNQSKYLEAKDYFEKLLQVEKQVFGEESPSILRTMMGLGVTLYKLKEAKQSLQVFRQVLNIQIKTLNASHPHIATTEEFMIGVEHEIKNKWSIISAFIILIFGMATLEFLGVFFHPHFGWDILGF